MNIGLDFGTTNSVAAFVDADGEPRVLPLDEVAPDANTLRTLLYVERDGSMHVGRDAVNTHRTQNLGRVPMFSKQWIGYMNMDVGEIVAKGYSVSGSVILDLFADVDSDAPGRLLHSLKGPLATNYKGTSLFGKWYSLEDLIAHFLERIRTRIESITDKRVQHVVLGRPVNFASAQGDVDNARAEQRLQAAANAAGFGSVSFEMEPIAAGLAVLHRSTAASANLLVFDFGGGTLDIAVLRAESGQAPAVLATGGLGIAGDHFDRLLFKHKMLHWFGQGVKWQVAPGAPMLEFPHHMLDALGDWQDVPQLCNEEVLLFIRRAQTDCSSPIRLMALEELIARGHAYDVYGEVERAKVRLSHEPFTTIAYTADAIDVWQPVTRTQFENYLARDARTIEALIDDTLARAGLRANQITQVVRTGGSSSIPLFVKLLARKFGRECVAERDLFTAVASGLALRAAST